MIEKVPFIIIKTEETIYANEARHFINTDHIIDIVQETATDVEEGPYYIYLVYVQYGTTVKCFHIDQYQYDYLLGSGELGHHIDNK